MSADRRFVACAGVLVAVRFALDAVRLRADPDRFGNWEESYNAAVAYYAWHAGLWDQLLRLQYKAFCGGCTVMSTLAVPVLALGGDSFFVWKLVPMAWTVATLLAGAWALLPLGRAPALAFLALMAVPPTGLSELGLMAWGNHVEGGLFVLLGLGLAARRHDLAAGVTLGLGVWFTRTTVYAPIVLLPIALWRRSWRFPLGLGLGALPLLVPVAGGDNGAYDLSVAGNLFPRGFATGLARLRELVEPARLVKRAWPTTSHMGHGGASLLAGAAIGALLAVRRREALPILGFLVVFAFLFAASGFTISRTGPAAPLLNSRYFAPWLLLLVLVTAAGAGAGIAAGGWRRVAGIVAMLSVLVPSVYGQRLVLRRLDLFADPGAFRAVDHARFGQVGLRRLDPARIAGASSSEPNVEAALRQVEGMPAGPR